MVLYKAELIHRRAPWKTMEAVDLTMLEWVSWFTNHRFFGPIGYSLPVERRERLESFPGWSWDPHTEKWEMGFSYLKEYAYHERHCRVPAKYRTPDDYRLGQWVEVQRSSWETIPAERKERLGALPGWIQRTSSTVVT